ncbi:MAG: DUF2911 domain-containing protein [Thermoanaerobaculia bacterium]
MRMRSLCSAVTIASLVLLAGPAPSFGQQRGDDAERKSKNGETTATIGGVDVRITYGRPQARGRTVWGDLVPYDAVWRAGADEATTITFSSDVTIEGQPLPAGTYALFTIPSQETWTVVFNKVAEQWGAYDYDESQDALRVQVQPTTGDHVEELTFSVEGNAVVLSWEKLRVPFKVEAGQAA